MGQPPPSFQHGSSSRRSRWSNAPGRDCCRAKTAPMSRDCLTRANGRSPGDRDSVNGLRCSRGFCPRFFARADAGGRGVSALTRRSQARLQRVAHGTIWQNSSHIPDPGRCAIARRAGAAGRNESDSSFTLWIIGYSASDVAQIAYFTARNACVSAKQHHSSGFRESTNRMQNGRPDDEVAAD
jgi:hypothetical protein